MALGDHCSGGGYCAASVSAQRPAMELPGFPERPRTGCDQRQVHFTRSVRDRAGEYAELESVYVRVQQSVVVHRSEWV